MEMILVCFSISSQFHCITFCLQCNYQCMKLAPDCRSKPTKKAKDRSEILTDDRSRTKPRTEMADHFLESTHPQKYEYIQV